MATYYVDDGGSATDPYDTWAKAATSLSALDDAKTLASGDIIYIGHDHVCQYAHVANRIITAPAGLPVYIISATQGSSPPTYQAATADQVVTTEGAYNITFDGSVAMYGVRVVSGGNITFDSGSGEQNMLVGCSFAPAANGQLRHPTDHGRSLFHKCTLDLTADGTTNRSANAIVATNGKIEISALTLTNPGYRTGIFFENNQSSVLDVSGSDLSEIDFAVKGCELTGSTTAGPGQVRFAHCKLASTFTHHTTTYLRGRMDYTFVNCANSDSPSSVAHYNMSGLTVSSTSVYRNGGASVESAPVGWLVTTTSNASEALPYYTPYIYGVISSAGSKTFTLYIGNAAEDLNDDQVWLEVESMGDAGGSSTWEMNTDQRAIKETSSDQTDDTGSTWSSAQTYMQSLAVTATVEQAGLFRARVAVAKASVTNLYVDPKVTVS